MLDEVNVYMASRGIFSLFFYLTTSICLAHSSVNGCLNDPASPHALGEITADTLLEEGQPIAINCTLSKEQAVLRGRNVIFNSSDILYEFESSRINNSQIIRPNSRTAIINITKSSIKNSGHYYCYLEVEKIVSFICSMHLEVGRRPHEIPSKDFKCISYEYENLTCTWNAPNYFTKTNFTLYEMYSSESVVQCPHINSDHSCSWTTSSHPPYLPFRKTLQMLLVTRNHFGNYSQVFDVHNFRIIKAPKVQKLTVESITSTSISLSWALPVALDYGQDFSGDDDLPHVLYEVRVSHLNQYPNGLGSMGEDAYAFPPPQKGKSSLFRTNSTFYNFIHLIPFQTYRFSIRCIVHETLQYNLHDPEFYWSDWIHLTQETHPDVPTLPPKLLLVHDSIKDNHKNRSVTLYWRPLSSTSSNGPGFHYVIACSHLMNFSSPSDSGNSTNTLSPSCAKKVEIDSIERFSYTVNSLMRSFNYKFKIYSANSVGQSSNYTEMVVGADRLYPQPVGVEAFYYGHNKYEIRWNKPIVRDEDDQIIARAQVTGYILSWCMNSKPGNQRCTKAMNSLVVNEAGDLARTVELNEEGIYHFGVSALYKNFVSTIAWASCTITIDSEKPEKLKLHKPHARAINTTAIRVEWKLPCSGFKSLISKFELSYCALSQGKSSCLGRRKFVSIPSSEKEFVLNDLMPGTSYQFQLTAWTQDTVGDESDLFEETTKLSTSTTLVMVYLLLIVLLLISAFYLLRICIDKYRHISLFWNTQIELPDPIKCKTFEMDLNNTHSDTDSFNNSCKSTQVTNVRSFDESTLQTIVESEKCESSSSTSKSTCNFGSNCLEKAQQPNPYSLFREISADSESESGYAGTNTNTSLQSTNRRSSNHVYKDSSIESSPSFSSSKVEGSEPKNTGYVPFVPSRVLYSRP